MAWARWLVVVLAVLEAGYMVFDGGRALVVGDYVTPKSGAYAGRLGPWAALVRRLGIDPHSRGMKLTFVVYGLAWLLITVAFAGDASWGWAAMLVFALASLWYAVIGTVVSALIVVLLLLPRVA